MHTTTAWSPTFHVDYDILKERAGVSSDGKTVGSIAQILHPCMSMPAARGHHYFLLDPGPLKDWNGGLDKACLLETTLPTIGPDRVVLNLTAEQVKQRRQEFPRQPAELNAFRHG